MELWGNLIPIPRDTGGKIKLAIGGPRGSTLFR